MKQSYKKSLFISLMLLFVFVLPVSGATIFEDNIDGYDNGDLGGQGDWIDMGGAFEKVQVQDTVVLQGEKALTGYSNTTWSIAYKEGLGVADGSTTFYIRTTSNSYNSAAVYLTEASSPIVVLSFRDDGYISYLSACSASYEHISPYFSDIWYAVQIEWRDSDKKVRYQIDQQGWTDWNNSYANFTTNLDTVRILLTERGFLDFIAELPFITLVFDELIIQNLDVMVKSQFYFMGFVLFLLIILILWRK